MIRKKIDKTKYIINIGDVTKSEISSDVLFIWTSNSLLSGDETFIKIHKEAGTPVRRELNDIVTEYGNEDGLGKFTFAVTKGAITSSGKLSQYYNLLHCVLPNYRTERKDTIVSLIKQTIKNAFVYLDLYSEKQVLITKVVITPLPAKLCGELNSKELKEIVDCLIKESSKMKEVQIICTSEEELKLYEDAFLSATVSFWEKWFIKLFKTNY